MMPTVQILTGDCVEQMKTLPDESVQCCVTSPPYFGLRDYRIAGQIGLETSPSEFVARLVEVFREVRRVLSSDGTLWLVLGDSYANDGKWGGHTGGKHVKALHNSPIGRNKRYTGLKPKDLIGIPWSVAFALRNDGWYLRSEIIWSKPNPMPESVRDRPTRAHEYIFLLAKSERYFYDSGAVAEPFSDDRFGNPGAYKRTPNHSKGACNDRQDLGFLNDGNGWNSDGQVLGRNKRSVWSVPSSPYSGSHFATFPPDLIKPCILAGCPVGGTVLDPFLGSGTTAAVALELGRNAIGIELNPAYAKLARERCNITPGLALV